MKVCFDCKAVNAKFSPGLSGTIFMVAVNLSVLVFVIFIAKNQTKMIIIHVKNKIDIIKPTLRSIPVRDDVCIAHNRKTDQVYVITAERNIDAIKVYTPVFGYEIFDRRKRNEIWNSDDFVYSGRLDYLNYNSKVN